MDKLSAGATVYNNPDVNGEYIVYEGTLGYEFHAIRDFTPTIDALIGRFDNQDGGGDYTYWNAGLALAVGNITFDFRYWDTDIDFAECGFVKVCDERFVFSVGVSVP